MKNLIFVVTHKDFSLNLSSPYQTIVVGNHNVKIDDAWHDNLQDNIADKNGSFCELTAMYWVWKNKLQEYDSFGLFHYRRFLTKKAFSNQAKYFIGNKEIDKTLQKYDIILPKKIYRNYSHEFYWGGVKARDMEIMKNTVTELFPDYKDAMEGYLRKKSGCFSNMFVMRRELFDKYSNWLFRILFELEKRIDISNYSVQEKRVFGYLAEMLLDIWVIKNKLKIKYFPYAFPEQSKRGQRIWALRTILHVNLWHPSVFFNVKSK